MKYYNENVPAIKKNPNDFVDEKKGVGGLTTLKYFSYIVEVSFTGGRYWGTRRNHRSAASH